MSEDNKAKMRQFYEEVVQNGNFARLDEFAAPNFVDHNPGPEQAPGASGIRQFFTAMHAAVTDLRVSVEQIIAEGDKVAAHISMRASTQANSWVSHPAGKRL